MKVNACLAALVLAIPRSSSAFRPPGKIISRQNPLFADDRSLFQEAMEDPYKVATLLLGTVLERRSQELGSSFDAVINRITPSYRTMREKQQMRIESLIETLREFDNVYDPTECLFGPLFCSLYWYTPSVVGAADPLWERISLKAENIKGQQYYFGSQGFEKSVINYSEIWGSDFHLQVKGVFSPVSDDKSPSRNNSLGLFGGKKKIDGRMRSCPDVFQVNITGGMLNVLGLTTNLPIEGSSNLVVLYADPRMRVFLSPLDSQSLVGDWENSGLVVVQVRSDLVTDRIDLR